MRVDFINLPATILTSISRKLNDVYAGIVKRNIPGGPWGIGDCFSSNNIYGCTIGAALTYVTNKLRNGLLSNLARRYPNRTQKRWLRRNRSWLLKSLLGTRENQERAMTLMTAQIPIYSIDQLMIEDLKNVAKNNTQTTLALPNATNEALIENESSNVSFYSVTDGSVKKSKQKECLESEVNEASSVRTNSSSANVGSVAGEIISSDDSEDDAIQKIQAQRQSSQLNRRKETRWKRPQRSLRGELRKTRSGRAYNFK